MLSVGLNPYGLAYSLGIQGAGTPRANPKPLTLTDYIALAEQIGARGIEIHAEHLFDCPDSGLEMLRQRFKERDWWVVIARPLRMERWERTIEVARLLGARLIRMHCTPILCGDRANPACNWPATVADVRQRLSHAAKLVEPHGLELAIENHQDFGSAELLDLCESCGDNVFITLDTANPLSVAEDPVEFAKAVKPRLRHVHLKDYLVQWTEQGYRLIRCATGGGCIPFRAIAEALCGMELRTSIEIGALESRHIKVLTREWWNHYPPRTAAQIAGALAAARIRRVAEDADFRTPWEKKEAREAIMAYELEQVHRSVSNLKTLGLM